MRPYARAPYGNNVAPLRLFSMGAAKLAAGASVKMPPYGEPLRNAPTGPALVCERPAGGWSLLPKMETTNEQQ
jgi:hypothetical protein